MGAILTKRWDLAQTLIDSGAKLNTTTSLGVSCLMVALYQDADPLFVTSMITRGADLKQVDLNRNTIFHYAAQSSRPAVVDLLLKLYPLPLFIRNLQGETPLMIARRLNRLEVSAILAPHEMRSACLYGDLETVSSMLYFPIDINALLPGGRTCIWYAFRFKHEALVYFLQQRGASTQSAGLNDPDRYGRTILFTTVEEKDESMVRFLVSAGANPNITDNRGNSPLSLAMRHENISMVLLLLELGASLASVKSAALRSQISALAYSRAGRF
jgi:ankyrin repeat protein